MIILQGIQDLGHIFKNNCLFLGIDGMEIKKEEAIYVKEKRDVLRTVYINFIGSLQ